MTSAERAKLAAILGMLGSDSAGERDAAALAAARMVQKLGVTWAQVLEGGATKGRPAVSRTDDYNAAMHAAMQQQWHMQQAEFYRRHEAFRADLQELQRKMAEQAQKERRPNV